MRNPTTIDDASLAAARSAQALRNSMVQLLVNPQFADIVNGAFVRVLVETPHRTEDYLLARICGVEEGETYTGFSQQANQSTNLHLRLSLPRQLSAVNGQLYQLNSISNSVLTREELVAWLDMVGGSFPPLSELERVASLLHPPPLVVRVIPPTAATRAEQPQQSPPTTLETQGTIMVPRRSRDVRVDDNIPTRDQLRHVVLEELRQSSFMVPLRANEMKTSQLRIVERDLIEYLERVRDMINNNRPNCVVCMDRIPTVITLPCKHRVLCRLCAAQVRNCPVCRQIVTELFEAVEI